MGRGFHVGRWLVEPDLNSISSGGGSAHVEPKAMEVLLRLAESPGDTVSKNEIIRSVWPDTFVGDDVLSRAIYELRKAFCDDPHQPQVIQTISKRGYRLIAPVERPEPAVASPIQRRWVACSVAGAVALAIGVGGLLYSRRGPVLTEKDTIVLADFENKTDDAVFDETLKQALGVDMRQSPYFNIVADGKVAETLQLMGRKADQPVTGTLARELCQRIGSKAMLAGSIAAFGSQYVIGLAAINCGTGDTLDVEQVRAGSKEQVLNALDTAASRLRHRLGESLASVEKFDAPLEQATTSSLEAWKAFSLGVKIWNTGDGVASVRLFRHAIELDPKFALAYHSLAITYANLGQPGLEAEYARRAYELRDKLSERERLLVEESYYESGTGELEKAAETCESWSQIYPRDPLPHVVGISVYSGLGKHDQALEEARESLRLGPNDLYSMIWFAHMLTTRKRFEEAASLYQQAEQRGYRPDALLGEKYLTAFLKGDRGGMERIAAAATGKRNEDWMLANESDTAAYHGQLRKARQLTLLAIDSALRGNETEAAAEIQAEASMREADFNNPQEARSGVYAARKRAVNRNITTFVALTLARTGDSGEVEKFANELSTRSPLDTLLQRYWLPTVRAVVELDRRNAAKALEYLQVTIPYELALPIGSALPPLYATYVRGQAYLMLQNGSLAAVEFRKLLDNPGLVMNFPHGALARLGLARAYALQGDTAKARAAYQDFLSLWKDADTDIPILQQAKAEYAKLK